MRLTLSLVMQTCFGTSVDDCQWAALADACGRWDWCERTDNLNLHIDLNEALAQRVDLDQTRVHGARKATELCHQANISLVDRLIRVWADDAAGNGSEGSDTGAQAVDHAAVPAGVGGIFSVGLDDLGVGRLQVLAAWRLDVDDRVGGMARVERCLAGVGVAVGFDAVHGWYMVAV